MIDGKNRGICRKCGEVRDFGAEQREKGINHMERYYTRKNTGVYRS